ncbi:unnamed protein product, partial [Brenthis ino]
MAADPKVLANFIQPCHAQDSTCLKLSAQNALPVVAAGIPSLGMNTLDPMVVDRVVASQAGLNMDFNNTIVKGLRHCHVLELRRIGSKTSLSLKCSVVLVGDYKLDGELLMVPIQGKGKYKIQIRDIVVKVEFKVGERESAGERYWTVPSWTHTADVLGGVAFNFQNLFNGRKDYAEPVLHFANTHWHDIFHEVAPPIVKAVVSRIVAETTKLFDKVPIRELALE